MQDAQLFSIQKNRTKSAVFLLMIAFRQKQKVNTNKGKHKSKKFFLIQTQQ